MRGATYAFGQAARPDHGRVRLGYVDTTLATYDEALRDGGLLLQVPVRPAERSRFVVLLQRRHDLHDLGYLGKARSSKRQRWLIAGETSSAGRLMATSRTHLAAVRAASVDRWA
jgi:hypothetical protein